MNCNIKIITSFKRKENKGNQDQREREDKP
jgi:hypothetical protein